MAKVGDDAALELALNDERKEPKKLNRHVVIALSHMNKRKAALMGQMVKLDKEVTELNAAIAALEE